MKNPLWAITAPFLVLFGLFTISPSVFSASSPLTIEKIQAYGPNRFGNLHLILWIRLNLSPEEIRSVRFEGRQLFLENVYGNEIRVNRGPRHSEYLAPFRGDVTYREVIFPIRSSDGKQRMIEGVFVLDTTKERFIIGPDPNLGQTNFKFDLDLWKQVASFQRQVYDRDVWEKEAVAVFGNFPELEKTFIQP